MGLPLGAEALPDDVQEAPHLQRCHLSKESSAGMNSEGTTKYPGCLADLLRGQRVHGLDHPGRVHPDVRGDVLNLPKSQPLRVVNRRHARRRLDLGARVQFGSAAQDEGKFSFGEAILVEWISHAAPPPKRFSKPGVVTLEREAR
jgi:hypothetical protein